MNLQVLPKTATSKAIDYRGLYFELFHMVSNVCNSIGISLQQAEDLYLRHTDSTDITSLDNFDSRYYKNNQTVGIQRNIDNLGRVVIPIEMRRFLDIDKGDLIEIAMEGRRIWLQKNMPCCVVCDSENDLHQHSGKYLCQTCINKLSAC